MRKSLTNGKLPDKTMRAELEHAGDSWNELRNNQLMLWLLDGLPLVDTCFFAERTWKGVDRQPYKICQRDRGSHPKTGKPMRSEENIGINYKGLTIRDGIPLTPADWWVISVCLNKTGRRWGADNYHHMARCLFRSQIEFMELVTREIDSRPGFFGGSELLTLKQIADHRKKKFEDDYHRRIRQRFESDKTNDPEAIEERHDS